MQNSIAFYGLHFVPQTELFISLLQYN